MKKILFAMSVLLFTSCYKQEDDCSDRTSTCQYIKYSFILCPSPETTVFELNNLKADTSIFTVKGCPDQAQTTLREGLVQNLPEPYNRLESQYPSVCNCW